VAFFLARIIHFMQDEKIKLKAENGQVIETAFAQPLK